MELKKKQLIKLYTDMVRSRKADELMVKSLQEGKVISFFHSGQGEEAVGVGMCSFLRDDDYVFGGVRGHGIAFFMAKGASFKGFLAEHYGKSGGSVGGLAGFHFAEPEKGILGAAGTIGWTFPAALGAALAAKKHGKKQVTIACFGDGASGRGTLHEAMNLASVWKLPLVWVCNNNLYAQYMPVKDSYAR